MGTTRRLFPLVPVQVLRQGHSPFVTAIYGAYTTNTNLCIASEWMNCGSIEVLFGRAGPMPEPLLETVTASVRAGRAVRAFFAQAQSTVPRPKCCGVLLVVVRFQVLLGLNYMFTELQLVHRGKRRTDGLNTACVFLERTGHSVTRADACAAPGACSVLDVKPSNILLNSHGRVKLGDYGLSIELMDLCGRQVFGTIQYCAVRMPKARLDRVRIPNSPSPHAPARYDGHACEGPQPERIAGDPCKAQVDVWSLGVTLVELATGQHPFTDGASGKIPIFELFQKIVHGPRPTVDPAIFSAAFCDLVGLWYVLVPAWLRC